jgi:hypothetical protein
LPSNYTLSITMAPMQIHSFFWATFASLIAPFGGFFASGLKRTFKIKDFGDSIPGHGGMTDRMDCQFIMGFFAYIYYHTFIAFKHTSAAHVLELAIMELTTDEQLEVVKGVVKYLSNQGIVKTDVSSHPSIPCKKTAVCSDWAQPRHPELSRNCSQRTFSRKGKGHRGGGSWGILMAVI